MNENHEDETEGEGEEEEDLKKMCDLNLPSIYIFLSHYYDSSCLDFDCLLITLLRQYLAVENNWDFKCHPKFN